MTLKQRMIKRALLSAGVAALLVSASASVSASVKAHKPVISDLPPLGDVKMAGTLVNSGDAAAAAGRVREALADYQAAIAASPLYEDAQLGLARCWATEGDYDASITYYRRVIYGHHETGDIDLTTEYLLVLSQAGEGGEAVSLYNDLVASCKKGGSIRKMEVAPRTFSPNGSDYDSAELQAMTHLMRAMNSDYQSDERALMEVQKAIALTPTSALVYFYQGVILDHANKYGAAQAFKKAATLAHGPVKVAAEQALKKNKKPV